MICNFSGVKIGAIAAAVPKNSIEIQSFAESFGEKELKRIIENTGVERVRRATADQTVSDLCLVAAKSIFEKLSLDPVEIDVLVSVTITPDYLFPGNSAILHQKLGLRKAAACFDISHGCSGFIYGLLQASMLIQTAGAKKVLLVVGESSSKALDPLDRSTQVLFGDAGTASLIVKSDQDNVKIAVESDGSGYNKLIYHSSGFRISEKPKAMEMDGAGVMQFVVEEVPKQIEALLTECGVKKPEVGIYFLHQANKLIIDYLVKKLSLDAAKVPVTLRSFGNTGSASIPLSIVAVRDLYPKKNWSSVLFCGFGVGYSWGTALVSLQSCEILDLIEQEIGLE